MNPKKNRPSDRTAHAEKGARPKTRPTLALAMMVKDEEAHLARCLDSVKGLVDEIVIVDTGSTDRTKEVAATYADAAPGVTGADGTLGPGLTLLDFAWCDDFSAPRNFGLDHVRADWAIFLDADEELVPLGSHSSALIGTLKTLSKTGRKAFSLDISTCMGPDSPPEERTSSTSLIRVFKSDPAHRFTSPIHEYVTIGDATSVGRLPWRIVHFGPCVDGESDHQERKTRNRRILTASLEQSPDDGYLAAMLGHEHFVIGEYQAAYELYLRSAKNSPNRQISYAPLMLRNLAFCIFALGNPDAALTLLADLAKTYPAFADIQFVAGEILETTGRLPQARSAFMECLALGDPDSRFPSLGGTGSWRAKEALMRVESQMR